MEKARVKKSQVVFFFIPMDSAQICSLAHFMDLSEIANCPNDISRKLVPCVRSSSVYDSPRQSFLHVGNNFSLHIWQIQTSLEC